MIGLRIPPADKEYHFLDRNEKNRDQPVIELICFLI